MGRRWGKTVMGGAISLGTASQGGRVAWIVPTYKNGRALWRWAEAVTSDLRKGGAASASKTERVIEFGNGGFLGIYSADNPDAIRGEWFHVAVLDEAARIGEEAWTDVIQPTLADVDGDGILISTPKGLNWFHNEWVRARDKMNYDGAAWNAPTSANPSLQIRRAFNMARERVTARTFKQEWLAEFVADGSYFQQVDARAIIDACDTPDMHKEHSVYGGLDFAMSEDYTVLTLGCRQCGRVVFWDRFNQIDYTYQRARIIDNCKRWNIAGLLPERNSIGQPNIELLAAAGLPILWGHDGLPGFSTTATTKPELIQSLAAGLEHDGFNVPRDYADELRSYDVTTGTSGHLKFSAPEGQHDDRVMSLALCWWAMARAGRAGL